MGASFQGLFEAGLQTAYPFLLTQKIAHEEFNGTEIYQQQQQFKNAFLNVSYQPNLKKTLQDME